MLERLKALDYALLVPGHGEPQADAVYLDRLTATIADIRAQVGPLARQGLSLEEVRERVDFSAQTEIFGTTPRLRLGFESYWLNPMVENAWKEARGETIARMADDRRRVDMAAIEARLRARCQPPPSMADRLRSNRPGADERMSARPDIGFRADDDPRDPRSAPESAPGSWKAAPPPPPSSRVAEVQR